MIALDIEKTRESDQRRMTEVESEVEGRGRAYWSEVAVTPERKMATVERFWEEDTLRAWRFLKYVTETVSFVPLFYCEVG